MGCQLELPGLLLLQAARIRTKGGCPWGDRDERGVCRGAGGVSPKIEHNLRLTSVFAYLGFGELRNPKEGTEDGKKLGSFLQDKCQPGE